VMDSFHVCRISKADDLGQVTRTLSGFPDCLRLAINISCNRNIFQGSGLVETISYDVFKKYC
jgi:hypothetical protein